MFSRGRNELKLHLIGKQLLAGGELFLAGGEWDVRLCWAPVESTVFHLLCLILCDEASASWVSQEAKVQALCVSTTQVTFLFSVWGQQYAILIHTPASAAPLTSRWPALHQQNKQFWQMAIQISWLFFEKFFLFANLPASFWRNLACHSWACIYHDLSQINGHQDLWWA